MGGGWHASHIYIQICSRTLCTSKLALELNGQGLEQASALCHGEITECVSVGCPWRMKPTFMDAKNRVRTTTRQWIAGKITNSACLDLIHAPWELTSCCVSKIEVGIPIPHIHLPTYAWCARHTVIAASYYRLTPFRTHPELGSTRMNEQQVVCSGLARNPQKT